MIQLYHGTTEEFDVIDPSQGKGYKDFGKGFYATARKEHAESIARRNKKIRIAKQNKLLQRNPNLKKMTFNAYRYNLIFSEKIEGMRNIYYSASERFSATCPLFAICHGSKN